MPMLITPLAASFTRLLQ